MDNSTKTLAAAAPPGSTEWRPAEGKPVLPPRELIPGVRLKACWAPYVMLGLALFGIANAYYVAQGSYTGQSLWCPIYDGCNTVAQSPYARIFGVPLSFLGLVYYLHMLGLAALLALDPASRGMRVAALLYTALGVTYSLYAIYLQAALIRAACSFCMFSAITTLLLFIAALVHFRAARPAAA